MLVAFLGGDHPDNLKTKILVEDRHNAVDTTIIYEVTIPWYINRNFRILH